MKHPVKIYNSKAIYRRYRRYKMIDRAAWKARQEIMAQEDAAVFAAMDAVVANYIKNK